MCIKKAGVGGGGGGGGSDIAQLISKPIRYD